MRYRYLFAVDPSLTCSGWALFAVPSRTLTAVGKLKSLPAGQNLTVRLKDLQDKIFETLARFELGQDDVLVCESQTTMRDPRAAFKVEQVRGIFETVARARQISVPGRLNPRSVQLEIMGLRGAQIARDLVKHTAVQVVKSVYGVELENMGFSCDARTLAKHQDIVDAILVGSLGLCRTESAVRAGVPLEQMFEPRRRVNGRRLAL